MDVLEQFAQLPDAGFGVFGLDAEGRVLPNASASSRKLLNEPLSAGEPWPLPAGIDPSAGGIIAVGNRWVELRPTDVERDTTLWITRDVTSLVEAETRAQTARWFLNLYPQRARVLHFVDQALAALPKLHTGRPDADVRPEIARVRIARLEAEALSYGMTAVVDACQRWLSTHEIDRDTTSIREALEDFLMIDREFAPSPRAIDRWPSLPNVELVLNTFRHMSEPLNLQTELKIIGEAQPGHGPLAPAIMPLLENALIHGILPAHRIGDPTTIHLIFNEDDHGWSITVRDHGVGIDRLALERRVLAAGTLTPAQIASMATPERLALACMIRSASGEPSTLCGLKQALDGVGGHVEIRTEPGSSTTVTLWTPRR